MSKFGQFFKWLIETQLVKAKSLVWRDIFMNSIALILVATFVYLTLTGKETSNEFNIIISMVLGFYFNHKSNSGKEE